MYAIVANGYSGIVRTIEELEIISALFPYPKFRKFQNEAECLIFLEQYRRNLEYSMKHESLIKDGSAYIVYFIKEGKLYATIDTSKIGDIRISKKSENISVQHCSTFINVIVSRFHYDDDKIISHCVAIDILIRLLGDFINIRVKLPDISILLACTKYTGNSTLIRNLQTKIHNRIGRVDFEV